MRLVSGINLGREAAYKQMRSRGFQTDRQGVTMHRPNEPGYDRPEVYLIDDLGDKYSLRCIIQFIKSCQYWRLITRLCVNSYTIKIIEW